MNFCPYCGTKLTDGEPCTCPGAKEAAAQQKKPAGINIKKLIIPIVAVILVVAIVVIALSARSQSKFDLSNYIVIDGVSGLNGNGVLKYYLDEDQLMMDLLGDGSKEEITEDNFEAVMYEQMEKYEEIGNALSCITVSVTADNNLSNGDTVTVSATFKNTGNYDLSFVLVDGSKEYAVSGLKDGIPSEAFANGKIGMQFSGVNGEGIATLIVAPQDDTQPTFTYSLSQQEGLSNGDVITISVEYNPAELEAMGYLAPETTSIEITVSGLTEYFSISDGLDSKDLSAICDTAVSVSKEWEADEAANDMLVTSSTTLVGAYFVDAKDPDAPYKNFWYGIEMRNAVLVVTNYATQSTQISEITRNYWIVWVFPDCTKGEDGHIAYDAERMDYIVFEADDFEAFYADFCEEFAVMTIVDLGAADH